MTDPARGRASRSPDHRPSGHPVVRKLAIGAMLALPMLAMPASAAAHVKWFEEASRFPLRTDLIVSVNTALLVGAAALTLLVLWLLQRALGDSDWPRLPFLRKMAIGGPTLLAVQAGIGLVFAATTPALFAPNMLLGTDALGFALAALQLLIAFSFITGILDWIGALLLVALGPLAFLFFPPMDVLDQLYWAGIGVALLVIGRYAVDGSRARWWFRSRYPDASARAVGLLRVITGIAILMPALSEKLWDPDIGLAFLRDYPHFNFMRTYLGQEWFTDDMFVIAAGVTEGVIGVALVSGLLTRLVILGMWLPFNIGVPFLPPQELLGHIPIFGIMYFLLVHSSGDAVPDSDEQPDPAPGRTEQPVAAAP